MKSRRVSVDLSAPAAAEIDRLRELTGLTSADLFRHSISLLRIYIDARVEGKELRIIDPCDSSEQVRLEFPISVHRATDSTSKEAVEHT